MLGMNVYAHVCTHIHTHLLTHKDLAFTIINSRKDSISILSLDP